MKTILTTIGICVIALILLAVILFFTLRAFLKRNGPPEPRPRDDNPFKNPLELPEYPEGVSKGDI